MTKPCGLLLCAKPITAEQVSRVLTEQGGPPWDETVFRLLSGVDVRSLVTGSPRAGNGTGLSLASSGWWLRPVDEFADRLAQETGQPVLATFEADGVSGYHLAHPGESPSRRVAGETRSAWAEGVSQLVSCQLGNEDVTPLASVAHHVHGEAAAGAHLPGMYAFRFDADDDWELLVQARGQALVEGAEWRPVKTPEVSGEVPTRMRSLLLKSAVRLPGPPRWARAVRAVAIRRAEEVLRDNGWMCLVPEVDGEPADYGTAVQILQLAPLPDGSALGVLHPLAAVRIDSLSRGVATVEPVEQMSASSEEALSEEVEKVLVSLGTTSLPVSYSEEELRASNDPALLLGWQLPVSPEHCQRYLESGDPVLRLSILGAALREAEELISTGAGKD